MEIKSSTSIHAFFIWCRGWNPPINVYPFVDCILQLMLSQLFDLKPFIILLMDKESKSLYLYSKYIHVYIPWLFCVYNVLDCMPNEWEHSCIYRCCMALHEKWCNFVSIMPCNNRNWYIDSSIITTIITTIRLHFLYHINTCTSTASHQQMSQLGTDN